jgi:DNA-binding Xre family transcriptional regulator
MDYPQGFPDHLKPPVDIAFSEAEIDFAKLQKVDYSKDDTIRHMERYIRSVYFAFAHAACNAVAEGLWTPEKCRHELEYYREGLSRHVYYNKGHWRTTPEELFELDRRVKRINEGLPEWMQIQEELKSAIQVASGPKPSPVEMRTVGQRLDEIAEHKGISHEELAHRIGVSRSSYFEVKAGRGGKKARTKTLTYIKQVESNT